VPFGVLEHAAEEDFSGYFTLGGFVFNPCSAVRPDNTGRASRSSSSSPTTATCHGGGLAHQLVYFVATYAFDLKPHGARKWRGVSARFVKLTHGE
jgi:hypothetical protein